MFTTSVNLLCSNTYNLHTFWPSSLILLIYYLLLSLPKHSQYLSCHIFIENSINIFSFVFNFLPLNMQTYSSWSYSFLLLIACGGIIFFSTDVSVTLIPVSFKRTKFSVIFFFNSVPPVSLYWYFPQHPHGL